MFNQLLALLKRGGTVTITQMAQELEIGFFYGGNIAGAVVGSVVAGFYLLRVYDLTTATLVAVGINAAVAAIALSTVTAAFGQNASEGRLTVGQSLTVSCQDLGPSLAGDRSSGDLDEVTRSRSKSLYCR